MNNQTHLQKQNLITAFLVTITAMTSPSSLAKDNVIYGNDDRKEIYEVSNPLHAKLADSTVAMISNNRLVQSSSTNYTITDRPLKSTAYYVEDERFLDQNKAAWCSGALIAKNLVLTAGHCYASNPESNCNNFKLVFGFGKKTPDHNPNQISGNDVVGCKSIVNLKLDEAGNDFAIIELDRDILHHEPLKLAKRSPDESLPIHSPVVMIGHPMGLPTKIDDGGLIRDNQNNIFYVAETDSYHCNSGSPIFNYYTGEIEGILVSGEEDHDYTSNGKRSKVCLPGECRGELLTKISTVLPFLPFSNPPEAL